MMLQTLSPSLILVHPNMAKSLDYHPAPITSCFLRSTKQYISLQVAQTPAGL